MALPHENWLYNEFHAFTMLYAANADGNITEQERNLILTHLSPEDYTRIKAVFQSCDDSEALDIILSYREKFLKTQADKDKILADMLAIYHADADFDQIERGVHQLFRRML